MNPTGATVEPLTEAVLGNARPILVALTAAVALLLLIACVNVGNLLLMRTTLRAREMRSRWTCGERVVHACVLLRKPDEHW